MELASAGLNLTEGTGPQGVERQDDILYIRGSTPTVLRGAAPSGADRLLFLDGEDLVFSDWPFADGSRQSIEHFRTSLHHPSPWDASAWGRPGGLLCAEGNEMLLYETSADGSVIASEHLFSVPEDVGLLPVSLDVGGGFVVHGAHSADEDGFVVVDSSSRTIASRETGARPLAVGQLDDRPGVDLLVSDPSRAPWEWALTLVSDPGGDGSLASAEVTLLLPRTPDANKPGATNAVAIADFDGDGHDDLALGYPAARSDGLPHRDRRGEGRVLIYRGPLEPGDYGPEHADLVLLVDDPAVEDFGEALLAADTDEDGIPELLVGAPGTDDRRGAAYRFDDVMRPWRELNGID